MTGKRVLYQEPQATFFHDVMTNLFTDKMTKPPPIITYTQAIQN